jgi:hypothetical protein
MEDDIEAVWEVAEHRYIYIVQDPERARHALVLSAAAPPEAVLVRECRTSW